MKKTKLHCLVYVVALGFLVISNGCSKGPELPVTTIDQPPPPPPPNGSNKPPIANAGADQTISAPQNTVMLDGSLSKDPDGNIVSFKWKKVAGPDPVDINQLQDRSNAYTFVFSPGIYQFELQVMDNDSAVVRDTMNVTVLPDTLTADTSAIIRIKGFSFTYTCTIEINNISSVIPSVTGMQVFVRQYEFNPWHYAYSGGWVKADAVKSSSYWYEIKNNVLTIHAAASIPCAIYDEHYLFYEVLLK